MLVRSGAAIWMLANVLLQAALTWRRPERLPRAMFEVVFAYLLFGALTYRSWYVIWLVGVAAVLPLGWVTARAVAWSATALFIYAFYIWVWHWWEPGFPTIQKVAVAAMYLPPLALSLAELASRVVARSRGGTTPTARHPAERRLDPPLAAVRTARD
jgi:hypothetical protein